MRFFWRFLLWLFALAGVAFVGGLVVLAVVAARYQPEPVTVPDTAVLHLDLGAPIREKPGNAPFGRSAGPTMADIVFALADAGDDDRIAGVVATLSGAPISIAQAQEISAALADFRASGKFSLVFAEDLGSVWNGTVDYLMVSAFEEFWLQPSGGVGIAGLALELPFFTGTLEKLAVSPQFEQRHEYKGGIDPFVEAGITPPMRESYQALLAGWSDQIANALRENGRLSGGRTVTDLFDGGPYLAEEAVTAGLVDKLAYWDELEDELTARTSDEMMFISPEGYRAARAEEVDADPDGPTIALIYGDGAILPDGSEDRTLFGSTGFAPYDVADALARAREDDTIDAVVFRIDSPGGAYGPSDSVWREVTKLRDAGKPVVASMATVAASGGYFVAMSADRILAQPGTVTGSIGVYSGKFATAGLWEKLGVRWDRIRIGENAAIWSGVSPFSESERERFRAGVDFVYADFTDKLASARALTPAAVDAAARGRAWTGEDARRVGLIDEFGGLREAIAEAKSLAGFDPAAQETIIVLPEVLSPFEQVIEAVESGDFSGIALPRIGVSSALATLGLREQGILGLPALPIKGVSAHLPAMRLVR